MKQSKKYAIAFSAAIAGFMATLELTVINVALTPMASSLKTDLASIQWVLTASFLAVAAAIPVSGYLGNRYGLRRVFMITVALFTLGSLACGLSNSLGLLIFFRVIQGLGGGAIIPLGQAIGLGPFAPEERAKALSVVALPILFAPAIGPSLGGVLTENLGWQSVFFLNVPLGILCLFLTWRVVPADPKVDRATRPNFDIPGLLLSMAGVVLIVYGLSLVSQTNPATNTIYGWGYGLVWLLVGAGLAVVAGFVFYSLRRDDPVLDVRLYTRREFALSSVIVWITRAASYAGFLLIPIFLQRVHVPPLTVQQAGLYLIPQGLASVVGVILGMGLARRLGTRPAAIVGMILMAVSTWPLTGLEYGMDLTWLQIPLVLRSMGLVIVFMPLNTLAIERLTGPLLAKGTALFNVTMQIFSSVGVALSTTLFVQQTTQHVGELAGQGVSGALLAARASTAGMNDVFVYMTIVSAILILPCLALPGRSRTTPTLKSEAQTSELNEMLVGE